MGQFFTDPTSFILNSHLRDLRKSLSGKDVPEDIKSRLLAMHEENVNVKEQLKTCQEKLLKAKAVRPPQI